MALKAIHDSLDDIPEQYQDLYTEKNGKFELTGIAGVRTPADVERVQASLAKEREFSGKLKEKLSAWDGMDLNEVQASLDRIPELEAAAKGGLDESALDEMATRRAEAMAKSKLAPVERSLKEKERLLAETADELNKFKVQAKTRALHETVRKALVESKVIPEAQEDALLLAERHFEILDDGQVQTREGAGVIAGLDPVGWLTELQEKRRHWWPESVGGGSRGSVGGGGGIGKNPFTHENWDMGEQGRIFKEHGRERADQLARAAGTTFGGSRPAPKK